MSDHATHFLLRLRNRHFFLLDLICLAFIPLAALALREDDALYNAQYVLPLVIYTVSTAANFDRAFLVTDLYSGIGNSQALTNWAPF